MASLLLLPPSTPPPLVCLLQCGQATPGTRDGRVSLHVHAQPCCSCALVVGQARLEHDDKGRCEDRCTVGAPSLRAQGEDDGPALPARRRSVDGLTSSLVVCPDRARLWPVRPPKTREDDDVDDGPWGDGMRADREAQTERRRERETGFVVPREKLAGQGADDGSSPGLDPCLRARPPTPPCGRGVAGE
ncbi:hypothetical protein CDD83_8500 [Cordyceps sp. RAO-2017]|nr:hypothetical protein CDD83_8500 [Cordyceps sp. RAO-2017]